MLTRRGTTLVELLVALVLAALVLGAATGSLLRQQRTTATLAGGAQSGAQGRAGGALLAAPLSLQAATSDDLADGEARDSALQLRTVVATGLACDRSAWITFATTDAAGGVVGIATAPRAGDTLWWLVADSARWLGRPLLDTRSDTARCAAAEAAGGAPVARPVQRLRTVSDDSVPMRAPLRITRIQRIALYRAGDGSWQLGLRDWSDAAHAFVAPQPAAGPFQRLAADGARTGLRYFDSSGAELGLDGQPVFGARIARVRLTMIAPSPGQGAPGSATPARDSVDVALRRPPPP